MSSYVPLHDRPPYYTSLPTPPRDPHRLPSPRYGSPDLDLKRPSGTKTSTTVSSRGGQMSDYGGDEGYEGDQDHQSHSGPSGSSNGAGEGSRKRPRHDDSDEAHEHGGASHRGSQGQGGQPRYGAPRADVAVPPDEPIVPSLFGVLPRDSFTRYVGDWIMHHCRGRSNVEIEIKLGTLTQPIHRETKGLPISQQPRFRANACNETILPESAGYLGPFLSSMTVKQNSSLNVLLNSAFIESQKPGSPYKTQFFRAYQIDTFFSAHDGGGKVRVSRDKDGNVIPGGVIRKRRIADLDVSSPMETFDWRISISEEEPFTGEMPTGPQVGETRTKDRACYRHQLVQVDLTAVRTLGHDGKIKDKTNELEVEILDVPGLLAEGEWEAQGMPNRFDEKLQACMNTARMLIRNVDS